MDSPLVSVVVPIYNTEKYLPDCINSILNQTYRNLELLLVNDGSTDSSLEICRQYAQQDARVRVFTQLNQGQGVARNLALDQMRGDYVSFVDSDDYIELDALEDMLSAMRTEKVELVICGMKFKTGLRTTQYCAYENERVFTDNELLREYLLAGRLAATVTSKLFAADLFHNLRFPRLRMNEDAYILPMLLGKTRNSVSLPICPYVQNIRDGSTERSGFSERSLAALECDEALYAYLGEEHPELLQLIPWKKANTIATLMRKILEDGAIVKYIENYRQLRKQLDDAWDNVLRNETITEDASEDTRLAHRHPHLFAAKYLLRGVYVKCKRVIKKVLIALKKQ